MCNAIQFFVRRLLERVEAALHPMHAFLDAPDRGAVRLHFPLNLSYGNRVRCEFIELQLCELCGRLARRSAMRTRDLFRLLTHAVYEVLCDERVFFLLLCAILLL